MKTVLKITAQWDDEAEVWVATSDDLRGLVTESDTVPNLISKLKIMIPELLESNSNSSDHSEIAFELLSSYRGVALSHAH